MELRRLFAGNIQLFHHFVKRGPTDAEFLRGGGDFAGVPSQYGENHFAFQMLARFLERGDMLGFQSLGQLQLLRGDGFSIGHDAGAFDAVFQLADVTRQ